MPPIQRISLQIIRSAICASVIWGTGCACTNAQNFQEKTFTVKDGLPANVITTFCQDRQGLIWIGTNNGMASFDGYTFKVFHHNAKDSNSLSSDKISFLFQDRKNRIWISTYNGLNCFDPVTQRFTRISLPLSTYNHIPNQQTDRILEDATGRLWIGTYNGLYYWDESKSELKEFRLDSSVTVKNYFNWIVDMSADDKSFLYLITNHGNCIVDYIHLKCYTQKNNPLRLQILEDMGYGRVYELDHAIYYWRQSIGIIGCDLMNYDFNTNKSIIVAYENDIALNDLTRLQSVSNRQFLVNAKYFLNGKTLEKSTLQLTIKTELNWIDKTKRPDGAINFWGGTTNGLVLLAPYSPNFRSINLNDSFHSFHLNSISRLLLTPDNSLWIGTAGAGVNEISSANRILFQRFVPYPGQKFYYNFIWDLHRDNFGKIWIGRQSGYSVYDPHGSKLTDFFFYRNDSTGNKFYLTNCFYQASDSVMYIGSNKGLAEANVSDGEIRKWFVYNPRNAASFPVHRVFRMAPDSGQKLWIASDEEVLLFDMRTNEFETLQGIVGKKSIIPAIEVNELIVHGNKLFIAATEGLFIYDKSKKELRSFTNTDGLPSDEVWTVLPVNDNIFWLVTPEGLSQLNLQSETFTNYTYRDGLPSFENGTSNLIQMPDGKIIFGMDSDLISFDPHVIRSSGKAPRTFITHFAADGKNVFVTDSGMPAISVPWTTRMLNIHFSTLQYSDAGFVQYQYHIDQIDKNWNNSFANNEVNYSDLPPGKYHFEVRAGYGNGKWGNPSGLIIQVQTPFWRTWWFWILVTAILLSIPLLIFLNIITRQRAKILQQQKLNAERQRISAELHDDVGSALTKIALMGQSVQHDPEQLKNMIPRMTVAADQMVDQMNEIIWALNIRNDTLQNLLAYLHKYSSEFLDDKFILHISEDELIPDIELSGEVRRNIFLVAKEALHNILKHSEAQHVYLKFEVNHALKITIEDDGKGISEEKNNAFGNGMQNMKMRMQQIGGSLQVISPSANHHGTKIHIIYPLK